MPEVRTSIDAIVFKPIPGGYFYPAPNRRMFGAARYYLTDEAQKAAILAILTPRRPILFQCLLWIAFTMMVAAGGAIVWACTGHDDPTPGDIVIWVGIVVVEVLAAQQILRWRIRRRLRPILDRLPPTDERITCHEMRQAFAVGANSPSIRQMAFAGAGSILAFTTFLLCFVFDLALGLHLSFLHLSGTVLFGFSSVVWFRRSIRKAELPVTST
jgi:hypothetical protein